MKNKIRNLIIWSTILIVSIIGNILFIALDNNKFPILLIIVIPIICLITIFSLIETLNCIVKIISYLNSIRGFGKKSDMLFRKNIDMTEYTGTIVDKKIKENDYYFLLKDNEELFMTFSVNKKMFYQKEIGKEVTIPIDREKVRIPGIIIYKYVEDEIFYVAVKNKYGVSKYSVDFDDWDKLNVEERNYNE